jgi:hypothetical protein
MADLRPVVPLEGLRREYGLTGIESECTWPKASILLGPKAIPLVTSLPSGVQSLLARVANHRQ